jgi:N-acetylglucosaminyldiphosphoundecaprenol N-acetyl-beta-D-mannosaminyltransferase
VAAVTIVTGVVLARRWKRVPVATQRIRLLDAPVDPLTMDEALARIEEYIASGRPHHIVTADASGLMRAQDDPELLSIIQRADLVTPDGAGVMLASHFSGRQLPERVSGVDLVEQISARAASTGYRLFLFGAEEGMAEAAAEKLTARYPGLRIVGARHGFFSPEEEPAIVQQITEAQPDVLFVALGIPKQEQFIRRHFEELGIPVMVGVGGSFNVVSGRLRRAPRWMQRAGLEWLHRLLIEPTRLPRLAALPRFIVEAWRRRDRNTATT